MHVATCETANARLFCIFGMPTANLKASTITLIYVMLFFAIVVAVVVAVVVTVDVVDGYSIEGAKTASIYTGRAIRDRDIFSCNSHSQYLCVCVCVYVVR